MCVTRLFLTFQAETHLVFPRSASVDQLRRVREMIAAERDQRLGADQRVSCSSTSSSTSSPAPTPTVAAEPQRPIELPPSVVGVNDNSEKLYRGTHKLLKRPVFLFLVLQLGSKPLLGTLQSNFQHVMVYENAGLQQKALSCVPHEQLCSRAKERLHKAREADPGESLTGETTFFSSYPTAISFSFVYY